MREFKTVFWNHLAVNEAQTITMHFQCWDIQKEIRIYQDAHVFSV